MILSLVLFSLMDAAVKWLGSSYATSQIMFFRCFVAMVPVITLIAMRGGLQVLKTQQKNEVAAALGQIVKIIYRAPHE